MMDMEMFGGLGEDAFEGFDMGDFKETDITASLETKKPLDDYTMLRASEIEYPCIVTEVMSNAERIKSLASGLLKGGDTQLYVKLKSEDNDHYLALNKIAMTPKNVNNLIRISLKDSVKYGRSEEDGLRLAVPEQFVRSIEIPLDDASNDTYWEELVKSESEVAEKDLFAEFE